MLDCLCPCILAVHWTSPIELVSGLEKKITRVYLFDLKVFTMVLQHGYCSVTETSER